MRCGLKNVDVEGAKLPRQRLPALRPGVSSPSYWARSALLESDVDPLHEFFLGRDLSC